MPDTMTLAFDAIAVDKACSRALLTQDNLRFEFLRNVTLP